MSVEVYDQNGDTLATLVNGRMQLHRGTVAQAREYIASVEFVDTDHGKKPAAEVLEYIESGCVAAPPTDDEWRTLFARLERVPDAGCEHPPAFRVIKPDASMGVMDDKSAGNHPVYRDRYIRKEKP